MAKGPSKPGRTHPISDRHAPDLPRTLEPTRRVTEVSGCPVVGSVAIALHGDARNPGNIDSSSSDFGATHERLEAAGIMRHGKRREHVIDGVSIRVVGGDSLGGPTKRLSAIRGVKVFGQAHFIRRKRTVGLEEAHRRADILDVPELSRIVPLKGDVAGKLPTKLRAPFELLVEDVHGPRRTTVPPLRFWKVSA